MKVKLGNLVELEHCTASLQRGIRFDWLLYDSKNYFTLKMTGQEQAHLSLIFNLLCRANSY